MLNGTDGSVSKVESRVPVSSDVEIFHNSYQPEVSKEFFSKTLARIVDSDAVVLYGLLGTALSSMLGLLGGVLVDAWFISQGVFSEPVLTLWGVGAGAGVAVVVAGAVGVRSSWNRKLYRTGIQVLGSSIEDWLLIHHHIILVDDSFVDEIAEEMHQERKDLSFGFVAEDGETYIMFRHTNDKGEWTGSWGLKKSTSSFAVDSSRSQMPKGSQPSMWPADLKELYDDCVKKFHVLSGVQLAVEEQHAVNRATAELAEVTEFVKGLVKMGHFTQEDQNTAGRILSGLLSELGLVVEKHSSVFRKGLGAADIIVSGRKQNDAQLVLRAERKQRRRRLFSR